MKKNFTVSNELETAPDFPDPNTNRSIPLTSRLVDLVPPLGIVSVCLLSVLCGLNASLVASDAFWAPGESSIQSSTREQESDPAVEAAPGKLTSPSTDDSQQETAAKFDAAKNLASFDQVWSTIRKSHWDPELVGASWDAVKAKYRPQVEQATGMGEVRKAIRSMIDELGQSHFGVIPVDAYDVVKVESAGKGYSGIVIRLMDGDHAVVTDVAPKSPALQAGIKPGWRLIEVGSRPVDELIKKFKSAGNKLTRLETIAGLSLTRMCTGPVGGTKTFVFSDAKGETQTRELKLGSPPGKPTKFGNFPEMVVEHETRTLPGGIGYFRFNMFFDPVSVMKAYNDALANPDHQNGFIIDVRGNIGGLGGMTMGMARPFVTEKTKLGTMIMRTTQLKFAVFPAGETYTAPVAILIDECSISSAEILSGGLQDIGAARVFGRRTAGLALPSIVARLPNGDGFQYAFANYLTEKGKSLEKDGVTPDEPIELTQESIIQQNDPVLKAAMQWIRTKPDAVGSANGSTNGSQDSIK